MHPRLSVVVPVYDNWWLTARTLRALDALRDEAPWFETIVVDNASTDETPDGIRAFPWVQYERFERNRNFAGACNAGARAAQAPLLLFLNNDAYPLGDALTPLVRAFEQPDVAIAGGALLFEDGATQCAGFVVLPNAHWHYSCRNLPATLDAVVDSRDALGVSGAAMAVRTDWFTGEGGFDESYVNGFEDVDLCMRARERGLGIRYVAAAKFAHYEAASAGRFDREAENEAQFYRRWSGWFETMPRTDRGEVRGITVHTAPAPPRLSAAALDDLERALRGFGHPVVRGAERLWHRFDRRFRATGAIDWFSEDDAPAGVTIARYGGLPVMQTRGAAELQVPWLPCAAPERVAALPLRRSHDPECAAVAIAGFELASPERKREAIAALDGLFAGTRDARAISVTQNPERDELAARFGDRIALVKPLTAASSERIEVACAVQLGLTDDSAFGNVLLAQAELPTVAADELESLFPGDVALVAPRDGIAAAVTHLLGDPAMRARYGKLVAADARRRFSPRRSAIRVVDLLCAARFGLELPAAARSNTPLAR